MAGYSGRALHAKLGFKDGHRVHVRNPPPDYLELLGAGSPRVRFLKRLAENLDIVHLFTTSHADLKRDLGRALPKIAQNGMIWVSWPKKASKVPTDVTEDVVRGLALGIGLVDVKVCAVDATWSALKLVIRRENRTK